MSRVLALVVAAAILIVSLLPTPPVTFERVRYSDKIEHVLAYAAWGALVYLTLPGGRRRFLLTLLIGVVFGGVIELLQPLTGRSRDLLDLLADAVGTAGGAAAAWALRRRRSPTA